MTVFVVTSTDMFHMEPKFDVETVCTSKDKAEDFIKNEERSKYVEYDIVEMEVL